MTIGSDSIWIILLRRLWFSLSMLVWVTVLNFELTFMIFVFSFRKRECGSPWSLNFDSGLDFLHADEVPFEGVDLGYYRSTFIWVPMILLESLWFHIDFYSINRSLYIINEIKLNFINDFWINQSYSHLLKSKLWLKGIFVHIETLLSL